MLFKFFRYLKYKKIVKKEGACGIKRTCISYSMRPSLVPEQSLIVVIDWDDDRGEYEIVVRRGTKSKNLWLKPTLQLDAIMCQVKELSPPTIVVDYSHICDGTSYRLEIGDLDVLEGYDISFRWMLKIPEEFSNIAGIVQDLERIGDKIIPPDPNF